MDTGVVFENIKKYICERVVNTTEATKIMNCSRQNINDLVKRKKIVPIKKTLKGQLFLKNELEQI
ncbi:MAG: DNA-binding protein [Bacilli bacterium]|nr:DNA-binding protein [Bacilli bacterium]